MTNAGAGFCKKNRQGNQIYPANSGVKGSQVAELSSHEDIQERDLDPDEDIVIEELGQDPRIRQREEGEHVVKVELDRLNDSRLTTFFDETELAELEKKEQVVTGEDSPSDYDEAMENMRRDIGKTERGVSS